MKYIYIYIYLFMYCMRVYVYVHVCVCVCMIYTVYLYTRSLVYIIFLNTTSISLTYKQMFSCQHKLTKSAPGEIRNYDSKTNICYFKDNTFSQSEYKIIDFFAVNILTITPVWMFIWAMSIYIYIYIYIYIIRFAVENYYMI